IPRKLCLVLRRNVDDLRPCEGRQGKKNEQHNRVPDSTALHDTPFLCFDLPQVGEVFPLTENAERTAKKRRITTVLSARAYSDNAELRAFLKAEEVRKRSSAGRETQRESGARALAKRGILP